MVVLLLEVVQCFVGRCFFLELPDGHLVVVELVGVRVAVLHYWVRQIY